MVSFNRPNRSNNSGNGAQLLRAAAGAKHVAHWLKCELCGETTDQRLTVSGRQEYYTCANPNCNHTHIVTVG